MNVTEILRPPSPAGKLQPIPRDSLPAVSYKSFAGTYLALSLTLTLALTLTITLNLTLK